MTASTIPQLSRPQRRELIRLGRKSRDPDTAVRFRAIAQLAAPAGPSKSAVARGLGIATSTVVSASRRYLLGGVDALYDQRRYNGRDPKVTSTFVAEVRAVLAKSPPDFGWERPTWTRELLAKVLEARGQPLVSVATMGRVLARLGARLGSPRPVVVCPWPQRKKQKVLNELKRLEAKATGKTLVFYADEVDIHLNPKLGHDWMLPGVQRVVVTPGKNEKRYVAGALDASTRKLICVEGESKNSLLFCELIQALVDANPDAGAIHVILDNYIIHSSKLTCAFLERFGARVMLHFLPPYCPDNNRIERIWQDLHANVTRNHRCADIETLMHHVRAFVRDHEHRESSPLSLRRAIKAAA